MIGRRLFLLLASLVASAACWSLSAELDVSGGSAPSVGEAGADANRDAGVGPSPSGSPDAASPPSDAGGEGVLFAEAFDDRTVDPLARFAPVGSGAVTLDEGDFASPPRSMRAVAGATGFGGPAVSIGIPLDSSITTGIRVSFAAKVDAPNDSFGEIDPVFLRVAPPAPGTRSQFFAFAMYPGHVGFESNVGFEDGGGTIDGKTITFPRGSWERVEVVVSATPPGSVTATVRDTTATYPLGRALTSLELVLGTPYSSSAQGAVVHVDDLRIERLP